MQPRCWGPLQGSCSCFSSGPENSASVDQPLPKWQKRLFLLKLSCSLGGVSSYPTMELAFLMSGKLKTGVHRKTVHSQENGHRLRLVKQMQQISLVQRSKLKCLAHSVQSPKKWFLCLKRGKREPARHLYKATTKVGCNLPMVWLHVGHQARGLMHLICTLGGCNAAATEASCKTGD